MNESELKPQQDDARCETADTQTDVEAFRIVDDESLPLEGVVDIQPPQLPRKRVLFKECAVAGVSFHLKYDDELWFELEENQRIALVRDRKNKYDKNAVAVALYEDYTGDHDEVYADDDCTCFVLANIAGPVTLDLADLVFLGIDTLGKRDVHDRLEEAESNRLEDIFKKQLRGLLPPEDIPLPEPPARTNLVQMRAKPSLIGFAECSRDYRNLRHICDPCVNIFCWIDS